MSETPRTDEMQVEIDVKQSDGSVMRVAVVPANFAGKIEKWLIESKILVADKEKQLAEARAEIERKDKLIEQMREALKQAVKYVEAHAERTKDRHVANDLRVMKAALAAERGE